MNILVTGASGYIGSRLVAVLAADHDIVGVVRRTSAQPQPNINYLQVDDIGDIQPAHLEAIDCVIHAAGVAETGAGEGELQRVNVHGSRVLAEACGAANVSQIIHLSSIKAAGEGNTGPSTPDQPTSAYGQSKLGAEAAIDAALADATTGIFHLRFPMVYGTGIDNNFQQLLKLAHAKWPLPIGALSARRSYCYVGNLIGVIAALIGSDERSGMLYVADPEPISLPAFVKAIAICVNTQPKLMPFPEGLLRLMVNVVKPAYVNQLFTDSIVDISETRERLPGWQPSETQNALSFLDQEVGRDGRI